jgi:hypothetical protein
MARKNPHAVTLGRRGGKAKSQAKARAARENGKKGGRPIKANEMAWSTWYRLAREEAAFRYGLRHIPVDTYKIEYFLGRDVTQGVRAIVDAMPD